MSVAQRGVSIVARLRRPSGIKGYEADRIWEELLAIRKRTGLSLETIFAVGRARMKAEKQDAT